MLEDMRLEKGVLTNLISRVLNHKIKKATGHDIFVRLDGLEYWYDKTNNTMHFKISAEGYANKEEISNVVDHYILGG